MSDKKDYSKEKIDELFGKIDQIIVEMENGELSLEESFESYKEASKMLDACKGKISKIEKEFEMLSEESK